MKQVWLVVILGSLALAQAQTAPRLSAAQQKAISAKAKTFTGKTCATYTLYQEVAGTDAKAFQAGIQMMLDFQKTSGVKSLKQKRTSTEFQQRVQQGSRQQYIYQGMAGSKTVTASCVLKP